MSNRDIVGKLLWTISLLALYDRWRLDIQVLYLGGRRYLPAPLKTYKLTERKG